MATFRKYGGTNFSPISNIVRHNIFNSKSSSFNTSGLYNSKETYLSHIDMSGNSLLHVGNIYFQDGTVLDTATGLTPPTLASVLNESGDGGGNSMTNLGNITQASNKIITQSGSGSNTLNATQFGGNITLSGNITQNSGTSTNNFNSKCKYSTPQNIDNENDIPNKAYVDTIASGLKPTSLCDCATTGNISLTGNSNPFDIDGYTVQDGNRVLVKSQGASTPNENTNNTGNGIYVYSSSSGNLSRASDCNTGDNITNQYSFVQNGTDNGLKAFFQINNITSFNPGSDALQYAPFYSSNYQIGQGLELVGGSPTTLRVDYSLNFLTDVSINSHLDINNSGGTHNAPLNINKDYTYCMRHFTNLSATSYNNIVQNGDNAIITYQPLSIAHIVNLTTNGIRIDASNVRLQANATSYYDLSLTTGHNFTGDCKFNNNISLVNNLGTNRTISTSYLSIYDISGSISIASKLTQIYQNNNILYFDNNANTTGNYDSNFVFACNNSGDDVPSKQTLPLTFNSSLFTIDMSNNSPGGSIVKYQACNNNAYGGGISIGHNFTGNCYFNNNIKLNTSGSYLQFPDNTKQYSAAVAGSPIIYGSWYSNTSISVNLSVANIISQDLSLGYIILPDPGNYLINYCNSIQILKSSATATLKLNFISLIINDEDSTLFPAVSRVSCNNNPRNATYNVPIDLNYDLNASCIVNVSSANQKYYLSLSMGYILTGNSVPLTSFTGNSLDDNAFTAIRIS